MPLATYGQLIDSTNRWNDLEIEIPTCKGTDCEGEIYITHTYHLTGETILNSNTYSVINDTTYWGPPNEPTEILIAGYIRQEGKKFYFRPSYADEDILLYDFGLQTGEIFELPYWTFSVINTDSLEIAGEKHLALHLERDDHAYSLDWIEDIGAVQGFLYAEYYFPMSALLCFEKGRVLEYQNEMNWDCIVTNYTSVPVNRYSELIVYVNPSSEIICIESAKYLENVTLADMYGRQICRLEPDAMQCSLDIHELKHGMYLIRANDEIRKIVW
jgi:hypothetical protein